MSVTRKQFAKLPLLSGKRYRFRELVRAGLKEQIFSNRIGWKRIIDDLYAPTERVERDRFKSLQANIARTNPQGAEATYIDLLYWMYSKDTPVDVESEVTPSEVAAEIWRDLTGNSLDEAVAALPALRDIELHEAAAVHITAGRWGLSCTENVGSADEHLSFALNDFQRPSTSGALGVYLELFAEPLEMEGGFFAGFKRTTFRTDIKTDEGADIAFAKIYDVPHAVDVDVDIVRKGTRLAGAWDMKAKAGLLAGRYLTEDVELFSLRPTHDRFEFGMTMSVQLVDLDVQRNGVSSATHHNKEAIIAAIVAKPLDDEQRKLGRVELAQQRYLVEVVE